VTGEELKTQVRTPSKLLALIVERAGHMLADAAQLRAALVMTSDR
jgi:hypothetical protein